jgi:lauroyl/myristoyl acyltransferase
VKSSLVSAAHQLRRLVPASAAPGIVRRKVDKLWTNDAYRELQEAQMRHLLEFTDRAPEIPVLARRYAEEALLKTHLRWHPRLITREPVRGIEWLTTKRDPSRSVVLSFMHHYRYEGMFKSLKDKGVDIDILATPLWSDQTQSAPFRHHLNIVASGGRMIRAVGGTDKFVEMVKPGMVLAIASDLPGQTEVTFLGRRVRGSFGAARIAALTNSQVVIIRAMKDENGTSLQVDPPIEPSDYAGPKELLDAMLRRHEEAILAWPEVVDMPRARFAAIED